MTFADLIKRVYYLRGDADYTTSTTDLTILKDHINYSIKDIINVYPFERWNVTTADLTLASGAADLPSDFNPKWGIVDARIVESDTFDDKGFTPIPIEDRDSYADTNHRYWITYNTTTNVWVFNTRLQTGTVTIYYYFIPTDLVADGNVCIVPDGEAVAYLAASKMWIGDERNAGLKNDYEQEATARITKMYTDSHFSEPLNKENNLTAYQSTSSPGH
jgi:hypothetical protein